MEEESRETFIDTIVKWYKYNPHIRPIQRGNHNGRDACCGLVAGYCAMNNIVALCNAPEMTTFVAMRGLSITDKEYLYGFINGWDGEPYDFTKPKGSYYFGYKDGSKAWEKVQHAIAAH